MWRNAYQFYLFTVLLIGCSSLILIIQRYKERYMAIIDAFILANTVILSINLDKIILMVSMMITFTKLLFVILPIL